MAVVHIVLFRPRKGLAATVRRQLADTFTRAVGEIPSVRSARVGRRVRHGRGYEQLMRQHFSHVALLEFDDAAGLEAYLTHPLHDALGRTFFECFEEALMYDYELVEGAAAIEALVQEDAP